MCSRLVLLERKRGVCCPVPMNIDAIVVHLTRLQFQNMFKEMKTSHSRSWQFHELNISVEKLLAKYCIHARSHPRQCSFPEWAEFSTCRHGDVCPGHSNTAMWPSPAKDPVPPRNLPSNPANGTPSCSESACPHPIELLVLFFPQKYFS